MLRCNGFCSVHLLYEGECDLMDGIRNYLATLIAAAFLCAVIKTVFGEKQTAVCSFACGLLMIITALRPIAKLDLQDISRVISRFRLEDFTAVTELPQPSNEIAADIIKEKTEAYIWDKAKQLQFIPEAICVTVNRAEEIPFPTHTEIIGKFTQQQRIDLTLWIEQNLAIGKSNQNWIWR